jgi:hypothetical protein
VLLVRISTHKHLVDICTFGLPFLASPASASVAAALPEVDTVRGLSYFPSGVPGINRLHTHGPTLPPVQPCAQHRIRDLQTTSSRHESALPESCGMHIHTASAVNLLGGAGRLPSSPSQLPRRSSCSRKLVSREKICLLSISQDWYQAL